LGSVEFLLKDDLIEEICVNGAAFPVWGYHRKYGWLKTDLFIPSESQVWNYSSSIARGVGRQINTQVPLLDAYLSTGDRVNATLFPISYFGNTITIRKFARKPWTITDYLKMNTLSIDVAALLWLSIQYETNIIVSGGTGAGKTSLLNVLSMFIPGNQRVVSIEQTREITLPTSLQWVPLVVREPTSEGRGEISMLDLMVNSLRMRPDRIIVGEIRRAEEANVLFEAMHTGHSVYATLHAETVSETVRRLTNPPINIPPVMMESLQLVVSMYRDRRANVRRMYELGELVPSEKEGVRENLLYRWRPYKDEIAVSEKSVRLMDSIQMHSNLDEDAIKEDLAGKKDILNWFVKNNVNNIDDVGKTIMAYYDDPDAVLKMVRKK
jgi:flagellar protein FlaI